MKDLHTHGVKAFALARELESTPEGKSTFVAETVGAEARRLGMSEEDLSKWLQVEYVSLWVRESNLNPGLDLNDVRKLLFKSFRIDRGSKPLS